MEHFGKNIAWVQIFPVSVWAMSGFIGGSWKRVGLKTVPHAMRWELAESHLGSNGATWERLCFHMAPGALQVTVARLQILDFSCQLTDYRMQHAFHSRFFLKERKIAIFRSPRKHYLLLLCRP